MGYNPWGHKELDTTEVTQPYTYTVEKEMATHSSILAWIIPWTEEPGGRQSMGPQTARDDRACTRRMQNTTSEINSAFMMG